MDNEAHINTVRELKGSKFCHPGHGIQNHWTEVLADVIIVTLSICLPKLILILFPVF